MGYWRFHALSEFLLSRYLCLLDCPSERQRPGDHHRLLHHSLWGYEGSGHVGRGEHQRACHRSFHHQAYWCGDHHPFCQGHRRTHYHCGGPLPRRWAINLLQAKLFRGNKNIYLYFMSFLHIDKTQVVEILPQGADVLATQYHGCWCPADARSQGINNHDIYYVEQN